jgi:L-alanine-DL-glutamate epimerase-like enolase superfamily enzyme
MRIRSVRTLGFAQPMIPIHQRTFPGQLEIVVTEVEAEDGTCGHSLARSHGGQPGSVIAQAVQVSLAPLVTGQDATRPAALWERMCALEPAGYVSVFALSALDVALWDLAGKIAGQSVAQLLGGRRQSMLAYASSTHYETIDGYVSDLQAALQQGYRAYKVHPFHDAARDIELSRALRAAAGPGVRLMLDATKRYDLQGALQVGQVLQELDFHWFEEPLPQHDWAGYARLRQALRIPIAGGETLPGLHHALANALNAQAYGLVLCDVYWKGGITGANHALALCQSRGVPVVSHHGASALMNMANLHWLCGASDVEMLEVLFPEPPYQFGLKQYPALAPDGRLHLPAGAGLGVELDWDYIESHRTG